MVAVACYRQTDAFEAFLHVCGTFLPFPTCDTFLKALVSDTFLQIPACGVFRDVATYHFHTTKAPFPSS